MARLMAPPNAGWPFSLASLLWGAVQGPHTQLVFRGLLSASKAGLLPIVTAEAKVGGPSSESSTHYM